MDRMSAIARPVGPVNTINGIPVFKAVATHIHWSLIGADYKVILENSSRIKKRFEPYEGPPHSEPVAIVAYGRSLKETWKEIRDFKTVITCSGSHQFLLDRGIIPTYHVDSDPRPHKVDMLGTPHPDVTYLIASICHPTYFDLLEKHNIEKVYLWHLLFLEPEIFDILPRNEWLFTGGNTVGPRAIKMARLLGYINHHYFGFDASDGYAGFHPKEKAMKIYKYKGKKYHTTPSWIEHARMMFEDLDRMPEVNFTFYGEGLIQDMAKDYKRTNRAKVPMAIKKP